MEHRGTERSGGASGHETIDHTADTGIEAWSPTLGGLLVELALGMFEVTYGRAAGTPVVRHDITIDAATPEDLVVDLLAELLYRAERDELLFVSFDVIEAGPTSVRMRVGGMPSGGLMLCGPPIKAVTYHGLDVVDTGSGWTATVVFDI